MIFVPRSERQTTDSKQRRLSLLKRSGTERSQNCHSQRSTISKETSNTEKERYNTSISKCNAWREGKGSIKSSLRMHYRHLYTSPSCIRIVIRPIMALRSKNGRLFSEIFWVMKRRISGQRTSQNLLILHINKRLRST